MTCEEARRILLSDFHVGEEPSAMAMVKAVEALEKQMPKKQDKHFIENEFGFFCCKETGKTIRYPLVSFTDLEFCPRCGQKIDIREVIKRP